MKLFVLLFVVVAVVYGQLGDQFDHVEITSGNGLNYGNEGSDTVESIVVGCNVNKHTITGNEGGNGPENSGSYITLEFQSDDSDSSVLTVELHYDNATTASGSVIESYSLDRNDVESSVYNGVSGTLQSWTCQTSQRCRVEYYCQNFDNQEYYVLVYQSGTIQESVAYNLTATLWREDVTVIPNNGDLAISFSEASLVDRFWQSDLPGPRSWEHYYIDLDRDLSRRGEQTTLEIVVDNYQINNGTLITNGEEVALCVNYNHIVSLSDDGFSTSASIPGGTDNPCSDFCIRDNLDSGFTNLTLEIGSCNFVDQIWIGVRTPPSVPASYDIHIIYDTDTIYPVTEVTTSPFKVDGQVHTDGAGGNVCDPSDGEYSCERYYEMSASSARVSIQNDNGLSPIGPFFVSWLHGLRNGEALQAVADTEFGAFTTPADVSSCGTGLYSSCTSVSDNTNDRATDCYVVVPPCQWNDQVSFSDVFVTTVASVDQIDDTDNVFFGLDQSIFYQPVSSISLAPEMGPFFDSLTEFQYHHYTLQITSFSPTNQLIAELYKPGDAGQLSFFWNFNDYAGFPKDCLKSRGQCNIDIQQDNTFPGYEDNHCRFQFIDCDTLSGSRTEIGYGSGPTSYDSGNGTRVANLEVGTYYFSVAARTNDQTYGESTPYTMMLWWRDSIPLENEITVLYESVYAGEFSQQFTVQIPDDDLSISGVYIHIADVQFAGSNEVTAYWQCDALAGSCPCYSSAESHSFDQYGHKKFYIPRCSCPSGTIYVGVESFDSYNPGYTVTAVWERDLSYDEFLVDGIFDQEIDVLRYPEWASVTKTIAESDDSDCASCRQYTYYRFSFPTINEETDTFALKLEFTPSDEGDETDAWLYVLSTDAARVNRGCQFDNFIEDIHLQACRAQANYEYDDADFNDHQEFSHCQIVFEACSADSNDRACYDTNNDLTSTQLIDRSFDGTRNWFAAVQAFGSDVHFTLYATIRSNAPTALVDGLLESVSVKDSVFENSYNHYSFSPSAGSEASIYFEVYANQAALPGFDFFFNDGALQAGLASDCFATNFETVNRCSACHLDKDNDYCRYQVRVCDKSASVYYVSVYQSSSTTEADEPLYYGLEHTFFNYDQEYTIRAWTQEPIELLQNNGFPVTGKVAYGDNQSIGDENVYTVTVTSAQLPARLSISLHALGTPSTDSSIYATISELAPSENCRCDRSGTILTIDPSDDVYWTRDNCDLVGGEVFYITVEGDSNSNFRFPQTYTVHAELIPISVSSISLVSQSASNVPFFSDPVSLQYISDSDIQISPVPSPAGTFSLVWSQYKSYVIAASAVEGRQMNVRVYQTGPSSGTEPLDVFLSFGVPAGPASSNGVLTASTFDDCIIDSNTGTIFDSVRARNSWNTAVSPCNLQSGNYYVTIGGDSITLNSNAKHINVDVNFIDQQEVIRVPSSSNFTTVTTTFADVLNVTNTVTSSSSTEDLWGFNNGNVFLRTDNTLGLSAGEQLTFTVSAGGSFDFFVNYGSPAGNTGDCDWSCQDLSGTSCTVVACSDVSANHWFVSLIGDVDSLSSFQITRTAAPANNSLSITQVPIVLPGQDDSITNAGNLVADGWQWYEISKSANSNDEDVYYELTIGGSATNGNVYTASSPVVLPSFSLGSDEYSIDSQGDVIAVSGLACGTSSMSAVSGSCCDDDAVNHVFAISSTSSLGSQPDIRWEVYPLSQGVSSVGDSSVGFAAEGNGLNGNATARRAIKWHSFVVPSDGAFYYSFYHNESTTFDVYTSVNGRAGDGTDCNKNDNDPACGNNDNILSAFGECTSIPADNYRCSGYVPVCTSCLAGQTFYFGVTANSGGVFDYELSVQNIAADNGATLSIPPSNIDEVVTRASNAVRAVYSHHQVSVNVNSLQNYFPSLDSEVSVNDYHFYVRLTNARNGSNVAQNSTSFLTSNIEPYINFGGRAGSGSTCFADQSSSVCASGWSTQFADNAPFNAEYECRISVSNLLSNCRGDSLWVSVGRSSSSSEDFSVSVESGFFVNPDIQIDEHYPIVSASVSSASTQNPSLPSNGPSFDVDFTNINVRRFDTDSGTDIRDRTILRVPVSSSNAGSWHRLWFDFTHINITSHTVSFYPSYSLFPGSLTDLSSESLLVDCNSNDLCFMQFVPDEFVPLFAESGEYFIEVVVGSSSNSGYDFGYRIESVTPQVFEVSIGSSGLGNDSLSLTKDIFDEQWQFWEFTVDNEGITDSITFNVNGLDCNTGNIEIYSSFSSVIDVDVALTEYPNENSHVSNGAAGSFTDTLQGPCRSFGGKYYIGVYAPAGTQLFAELNINDDGLNTNTTQAAFYSVSVDYQEFAVETLAAECTVVVSDEDRYVVPLEAENRGSQLSFYASVTSGDMTSGSVTFHVSRRGMHYGDGSCTFASSSGDAPFTPTNYEYTLTLSPSDGVVSFSIPACEFEQGYLFVYVVDQGTYVDGSEVSLWSRFDRKHIPTADLTVAPFSATWNGQVYGGLANTQSSRYQFAQYYKVVVDVADAYLFSASLSVTSCVSDECNLNMYITRGPVGYSFDYVDQARSGFPITVGNCNIDDSDFNVIDVVPGSATECACHDNYGGSQSANALSALGVSSSATIWDQGCYVEYNQYYIGIVNANGLAEDFHCHYDLAVNTRVSWEPIVEDTLVCASTACYQYYKYVPENPETITSVDITIENSDFFVLVNEDKDFVPFFADSTAPVFSYSATSSDCYDYHTISGSTVNVAPSDCVLGDLWIGVFRSAADLSDCSCSDAGDYSLIVEPNRINITAPEVQVTEVSQMSIVTAEGFDQGRCASSCDPVLVPGTYVVDNGTVDAISFSNFGSEFTFTDSEPERLFFQYSPGSDVISFDFVVTSLEEGCDSGDILWAVDNTKPTVDSCSCSNGGVSTNFNCGSTFYTDPVTCEQTYYLTVWRCGGNCDVTFSIDVEETTAVASGTTHEAAYTQVTQTKGQNSCNSVTSAIDTYYVDVTDILSITVRQPFGGDGVTVNVGVVGCDSVSGCSSDASTISGAQHTEVNQFDSCTTGGSAMYYCLDAGRYAITPTISGQVADWDSAGFDIQIVNQWVALSSHSNTIIGSEHHFYSIAAPGQAVAITLEVSEGPAIEFKVFDGCDWESGFYQQQYCPHGKCLVDISTRALHSYADTFYIVLSGGDIASGKYENADQEKPTAYTINAQVGSSACSSRPSSGFCGSDAASIDSAFIGMSSIAGSTWSYHDMEARDNMALCRYNSFIDGRCPAPTDVCKRWLRVLSCLDAFPECESETGFLQGTCRAVCEQVELHCGDWLENEPRPEFSCNSNRYENNEEGGCVPIPVAPTPTPAPVVVVDFNDIQKIHGAAPDVGIQGGSTPGAFVPRNVEATCSATVFQQLLLREAGGAVLTSQITVPQVVGNEFSIVVYGSNVESATSIAVRLINRVTTYHPATLSGTCLESVVLNLEEAETTFLAFSSETVPTSVVNPPVIDFPTVTIPPFTIPDITIPSFTIPNIDNDDDDDNIITASSASAVFPTLAIVLMVIFAMF